MIVPQAYKCCEQGDASIDKVLMQRLEYMCTVVFQHLYYQENIEHGICLQYLKDHEQ